MIEAVDWTTLVFFMSLFMVVGAIQEVGLISLIAGWIGKLVGDSLILAMVVLTVMSAVLSMIVANIPFTAAMLPVVGFLSSTVPGAEGKVLFYCLSVGAAMGGKRLLNRRFRQHDHSWNCRPGGIQNHLQILLEKRVSRFSHHCYNSLGWLFIRFFN